MVVHYLNYNGDRWRVETTGISHDSTGVRSAGADFIHEATGRHLVGRLNPADVERPTDVRLTEALEATLAALRAKVPAVFRRTVGEQTRFVILHSMYTVVEHKPEVAGRVGYSFSTSQRILDEVTTRSELTKFFGLSATQVDALLRDAPQHR